MSNSETVKPLLRLGDDASKAANKEVPKKVHPGIRRAVTEQVRYMLFGPKMHATFRQRALMYPSFAAMNSATTWANR